MLDLLLYVAKKHSGQASSGDLQPSGACHERPERVHASNSRRSRQALAHIQRNVCLPCVLANDSFVGDVPHVPQLHATQSGAVWEKDYQSEHEQAAEKAHSNKESCSGIPQSCTASPLMPGDSSTLVSHVNSAAHRHACTACPCTLLTISSASFCKQNVQQETTKGTHAR